MQQYFWKFAIVPSRIIPGVNSTWILSNIPAGAPRYSEEFLHKTLNAWDGKCGMEKWISDAHKWKFAPEKMKLTKKSWLIFYEIPNAFLEEVNPPGNQGLKCSLNFSTSSSENSSQNSSKIFFQKSCFGISTLGFSAITECGSLETTQDISVDIRAGISLKISAGIPPCITVFFFSIFFPVNCLGIGHGITYGTLLEISFGIPVMVPLEILPASPQ